MDIRRLRHFLALLDRKQFSLAARELKVSQQAVSKGIAKLEEELGVRLFERSAFGVTPTEYARVLEPYARTIVAESRYALAALNASAAARGTLTVGVGPSLAPQLMPAAINAFRALRPNMGVKAIVDFAPALQQKLLAGEIDLVVNAPPGDFQFASDVNVIKLFDQVNRLGVRTNHPLCRLARTTIPDLLPYTWLASKNGGFLWRVVCDAYRASGFDPPTNVVTTDSVELTLGLLAEHDYLAIIDLDAAATWISAGTIRALDVPGLTTSRPAVVAHRARGSLSSATQVMITVVRRAADDFVVNRPGIPGDSRC
jgi:DNA-binding transcriptional LysR family regulator